MTITVAKGMAEELKGKSSLYENAPLMGISGAEYLDVIRVEANHLR